MTCDCELCGRIRTFEEKVALLPEDQREYFENLFDYLMHKEFDNDYYEAILSGKWPSGREVLLQALSLYPVEDVPSPPPARVICEGCGWLEKVWKKLKKVLDK